MERLEGLASDFHERGVRSGQGCRLLPDIERNLFRGIATLAAAAGRIFGAGESVR